MDSDYNNILQGVTPSNISELKDAVNRTKGQLPQKWIDMLDKIGVNPKTATFLVAGHIIIKTNGLVFNKPIIQNDPIWNVIEYTYDILNKASQFSPMSEFKNNANRLMELFKPRYITQQLALFLIEFYTVVRNGQTIQPISSNLGMLGSSTTVLLASQSIPPNKLEKREETNVPFKPILSPNKLEKREEPRIPPKPILSHNKLEKREEPRIPPKPILSPPILSIKQSDIAPKIQHPPKLSKKNVQYKTVIFTWNHNGLWVYPRLDENEQKAYDTSNRYTLTNILSTPSQLPSDFNEHRGTWVNTVLEYIRNYDPDIIFFASQKCDINSDNFHGEDRLLSHTLKPFNYDLHRTSSTWGLNEQSYKDIKSLALPGLYGLVNSLYIKSKYTAGSKKIEELHGSKDGWLSRYYLYATGGSKGGLVTYLKLENGPLMAFLNLDLPFDRDNLVETFETRDKFIRRNGLSVTNDCYNKCIQELIYSYHHDMGRTEVNKPDIVFITGNLNYRIAIQDLRHLNIDTHNDYVKRRKPFDELPREMASGNIYTFNEGVNTKGDIPQGPHFMPTCKLKTNRQLNDRGYNAYEYGVKSTMQPSWTDRILYNIMDKTITNDYTITCEIYDSIPDTDTNFLSDHAAVVGYYTIF